MGTGQGGRMAITREPVGRQRPFKAETHFFSKIKVVFEAQRNDPTPPKGDYPVRLVKKQCAHPFAVNLGG